MGTPARAALRPGAEPSPAEIDAFFAWFKALGGDADALEIVTTDGLRGVRARRDIAQGEVVLFIPAAAVLSLAVAKASAIGGVISRAAGDDVSPHGYLAAFILEELRHHGVWRPYLRALPADFSDHPLHFTDDEMAHMQGSLAYLISRKYRRRVVSDFERINAALAEDDRFDAEDFRWAWCCVLTRLRGRARGPGGIVINDLQVMSEMFNHAEHANTAWNENDAGCLLNATLPIRAGELLTDSYGMKGNHSLFATWGFRLAANPHDETYLMLDAGPDTGRVGDAPAVPRQLMTIGRSYRQPPTREVFAYLRHRHHHLRLAPDASPPPVADAALGPIDRRNELAALTSLGEACIRRRIAFGPPVAEGGPVDAAPDLPRHLRDAVTLRQDEVRLLEYCERLVGAAVAFLEKPSLATEAAWRARIADDDYLDAIRGLVAPRT